MSNPFQGVRERGGLNGVRSLSFESMGISWQDVIDKRQAYFESLETEMDSMLERLCHQRNVRYIYIYIDMYMFNHKGQS